MALYVDPKKLVVPGTLIADGLDYVPSSGTYRQGDKIYSSKLGLLSISKNVIKIVPLAGKYFPKEGDVVIGKVIDIVPRGWLVDINSPYEAMLALKDMTNDYVAKDEDLSRYLAIGDYILVKIIRVSPTFLIDLSMKDENYELKKLVGGRIIKFNTQKIPRLIGKQGSMIKTIKKYLALNFYIGLNGLVWMQGSVKEELIFLKIIEMVDKYSHTSGLTERVDKFLSEAKNWNIDQIKKYSI
ncbi:MAG: exosome complex RNA-binding protein Rrp4 [Candidatus Woesearchaeota archaeon]